MAPRSKHIAGNRTQQIIRLFSARHTLLALSLFGAGFSSTGHAAIGDLAGSEFIVNTRTSNEQSNASVAMAANGDYVVTWVSDGQDGNSLGVFGQRFSADGVKTGDSFLVNTEQNLKQENPSIAIDAGGDFVVVWQSANQDGDNFGIFGQRFSADASKKGTEIQINTETASDQINPDIAMDTNGDFVVVWQSDGNTLEDSSGFGVFGQLYKANGSKTGNEFLINTEVNGDQDNPSVAMDANGDFVVIWQSDGNADDDSRGGIFGQLFKASGNKTGNEFIVNTEIDRAQENPDVAMDASGDFVVVWQSDLQDGDSAGIFGQRYNANGFTIENEFLVNTETSFNQQNPSVAMDANGDFVISWQSDGNTEDNSDYGIFSQIYNSDGDIVSDEFLVNTTITSEQSTPDVSMDANGDLIVVWQSDGNAEDADNFGVFGQRYKGKDETIGLDLVINGPERVTTGNNFTYEIFVTNTGNGIATDIKLTGAIPADVSYVSDDSVSVGWLCALDASTLLECNLPFLNPGASSTINVTVKSIEAGTVISEITATSAQGATDSDTERTPSFLDASISSSNGGGGSLSWLSGVLFLFALRRKKLAK